MTKWIIEYLSGDYNFKDENIVKMLTGDECSGESEWRITRIDDQATEAFLEKLQEGETIEFGATIEQEEA